MASLKSEPRQGKALESVLVACQSYFVANLQRQHEEEFMPMQKKRETHPHIERKRGVCGGHPVIKDTRFPVSSVAIHYRRGLTAEDILRDFPQLTPTQVYGALAYYFDHQEEIDAEIEEIRLRERRMEHDASFRLPQHDKTHSVSGS
jgi:uncharacterized protein (DUF433 family)